MRSGNGFRRSSVTRALIGALALAGVAATPVSRPAAAGAREPAQALIVGQMKNFSLITEPKPVPPATFRDAADRELDLGAFRGKVVLVNLWATWCVPCRAEMPALDRLQAALAGPDFAVVAIAEDRGGRDKAKAFLEDIGVRHLPLYVDATARSARAFGAVGLPISFLVDREGREVGRLIGPAEWDSPEAIRLIRHFIDTAPLRRAGN
jgi:thiol-disulfide isomerase/thioredoxin